MRVLVTNPQAPQAYAIIRALRPYATSIVATVEGEGLRARLAHAANSRLVDATHRVPSLVEEWSGGRFTHETTDRERAFVDAVERICGQHQIDVIFPSWDPYVFALSKHRERFDRAGVTVPVPSFDIALTALDKYRTVRLGEQVGFPCPRTYLYESRDQLRAISDEEPFPLVVKPRFTSGGRGMVLVQDRAALEEAVARIATRFGSPLIQEYIPGGQRDSVQLVLDRNGELVFAFHKRRLRTFRRTARFGTVSESAPPEERVLKTASLVSRVGWWGALGVETIRDPRDGLDKLMEINPRFPRQLWNRTELGINEPLMCIGIARHEPVEAVSAYPQGVLFVSPVEDASLFALQLLDRWAYLVRTRILRHGLLDPLTAPLSTWQQAKSFASTYVSRQPKVLDPYSRYFMSDPVASTLWWLQFWTWLAGSCRELGR